MAQPRFCRYCGGPIRLVPIGLGRVLFVHTQTRAAGAKCRRSRHVFGTRLMDYRQPMLPSMEWA